MTYNQICLCLCLCVCGSGLVYASSTIPAPRSRSNYRPHKAKKIALVIGINDTKAKG